MPTSIEKTTVNSIQLLDRNGLFKSTSKKPFHMIDNYVYLYHTDTLIAIPVYPESIQDAIQSNFNETFPLSRSAPIYTYVNSGPRSLQIELPLHRDMMNQINTLESNLNIDLLQEDDYVDILVKQLQGAALPSYAAADKMVNPPMVAVRFGNSIFCKGIIQGGVSVTHAGPILRDDKYALLTVSFHVYEVDPYDAETTMLEGGFRGIRKTLDSRIYKK